MIKKNKLIIKFRFLSKNKNDRENVQIVYLFWKKIELKFRKIRKKNNKSFIFKHNFFTFFRYNYS